MIIGDYYEKLYATKLENFQDIDKFLDTHNLPRLNQHIGNMNRLLTINEIEVVINSFKLKIKGKTRT